MECSDAPSRRWPRYHTAQIRCRVWALVHGAPRIFVCGHTPVSSLLVQPAQRELSRSNPAHTPTLATSWRPVMENDPGRPLGPPGCQRKLSPAQYGQSCTALRAHTRLALIRLTEHLNGTIKPVLNSAYVFGATGSAAETADAVRGGEDGGEAAPGSWTSKHGFQVRQLHRR